jgi:hypothetical protein
MKSLRHLNKFNFIVIIFTVFIFSNVLAEDEPADIWEKNDVKNETNTKVGNEEKIKLESPILLENDSEVKIQIEENEIEEEKSSIIGLFDPQENNFNLNMWSLSDGGEVVKIINRINKLNLSKFSEDLLFKVLFTNSYPPKINLSAEAFLKIKIDWLIKNNRIEDLESFLKFNPEVGQNSKAIKYLINEHLSSADIKSACEKVGFIDKKVQNSYLDKFIIYCLINNDQRDEAQLVLELLRERGFKDKFFDDKINFLLGLKKETSQRILDNNLLNFYFSYITSNNFEYKPNEKTNKYIWKYLSAANLIEVNNLEDENIILTYEQAAAQDSFSSEEIFKIYLKVNFNFNQILNVNEIYKNLPNYKARALIYQSLMLADNASRKIRLAFLLKDLFIKDKILKLYKEELSNILKSIEPSEIPDNYTELVKDNFNEISNVNIKYENDILHRSKVIKHFLENTKKFNRTKKDLKFVYKKIKKNKKYFISIKDIVVLESLAADGISIPKDLDYGSLSSQLTVPNNLKDLVNQNQIGLLMLKIIEVIGEDKVSDLDPETIYFLNRILNDLNLKKIRNNILREALPKRV